MGCDIHTYIDYDDFKTKEGDWFVSCFAENVADNRNYTLFALMAGVRYDPRTDVQFKPLFEPKGIPERVSYTVRCEYTLHIADNKNLYNAEGFCSQDNAERWVVLGCSRWMDNDHTIVSHPDWHSASWLTVAELEQVIEAYEQIEFPERSWFQMRSPEDQPIPDGATATKMTSRIGYPEWYVEVGEKQTYSAPATFKAVIAAMQELDNSYGDGRKSRLVFWFDN